MSRDGGFSIGDRSSRTLYDVRLVRAYRQVGLAAIVAWDAVVDASWEAGERVTFDDAVDTLPYDIGDSDAVRAALVSVSLLDDEGLIRCESWSSWFGVADDRREAKRERDRAYAARRRLGSDSKPTDARPMTPTGPTGPSGPTDRSSPRATPSKDGATREEATGPLIGAMDPVTAKKLGLVS